MTLVYIFYNSSREHVEFESRTVHRASKKAEAKFKMENFTITPPHVSSRLLLNLLVHKLFHQQE